MPLEGFTNCDDKYGWTTERNHPLFKVPYEGKILVYPRPRGSGGFMRYGRGTHIPAAYVHYEGYGNGLCVSCAMCAHIPSVANLDFSTVDLQEFGIDDPYKLIETGDHIMVNGDEGYIIVTKE
jgi:predicted aconitase with swiveling domain